MDTSEKKKFTVSLSLPEETIENFISVCTDNELSVEEVLTLFVQKTAREGRLPFSITFERKILPIALIKVLLAPLTKKYGIRQVWLCGDYAQGKATLATPLQFCMDFPEEWGDMAISTFQLQLEKLFHKDVQLIGTDAPDQDSVKKMQQEGVMLYG